MKLVSADDGLIAVELTRRNLKALLVKLDGQPADSAATILQYNDGVWVEVKAVEDSAHYSDRAPGEMHPDTEAAL